MNQSIIPATTAIQTFRDAGYKNTASALAELLDNSIEAGAENIQVMTIERDIQLQKRVSTRISEILVYDDGGGMPRETMEICLQFGNGTRLSSRKGMGRFGIGLPNASVSQCKRVEIYSWQDGQCHFTHLDVDEIKETKQQNVNPVTACKMPNDYLLNVEGKIKESGTLIIWKHCDRLDIARASTLFKRMEDDLCRAYRHYLDSDNEYGSRRNIQLINCGKVREIINLKANDPLYLMSPNTVPGFENEPTSIMHGETVKLDLPYDTTNKLGRVELRFSVALPSSQSLGGNSDLGKHYRANTGISFVRAAREIDFGVFGYFNPRDERHRWWGCEIRFEPIFDEVFGVTNNKQSVRGVHFLDLKEFKEDHSDWEEMISEDPRLRLRQELSKTISQNIKQLEDIIKSRGKGLRTTPANEYQNDKPTQIANEQLSDNKKDTKSQQEGKKKTLDEKKDEWKKQLLTSDTTLSEQEASQIAAVKAEMIVEKSFDSWPGSQFFSVKTTGQTCNLQINRSHPFFTEMYEELEKAADHKYIDALDLLLMAYARTQDELYHISNEVEEVNEIWGSHVKKFLRQLATDA